MSDTVIETISATEVIVPAKPGSLNSDTVGAGLGTELDESALEKYGTRQCVTESL